MKPVMAACTAAASPASQAGRRVWSTTPTSDPLPKNGPLRRQSISSDSPVGDDGFNVVLFNPGDAKVINCAPYKVTALEVKFEEGGQRWFASSPG